MINSMEKTFYFLAGLHRSGNTVVSSLLNQNPKIYSSPLSPVCNYLWALHNASLDTENAARNRDKTGIQAVISNLFDNHYSAINKPIVFDREKNWGTPGNLFIIKEHLTQQPKIVYTVRPIIEVLSSFMSLEKSWIDRGMSDSRWTYKNYLSLDENRCDYLMRPGGEIDQSLLCINEIIKPENKGIFHLVEYDDLINKPQETMNGIYNFIGIEPFEHDFNNIIKLEKDDDTLIGMPANLHKIRPELKQTSSKPEDVLSDYVINKYSNMEFWRK
jgi:sulfotransferase